MDPWRVLTAGQAAVAREYLKAREAERLHVAIYLSGAHAYGFPSPDSDLDLKCVHVAPTRDLVGLYPVEGGAEQIEIVDGVELDYGSNELGAVLAGAIKGNGNYLERILGALVLGGDPTLLAEARAVVQPLLSQRIARHYIGFATSQLQEFDKKHTAKRALYVLRTAATGRHALAHGQIVTDIAELADYLPPQISELVALKQRAEKQTLEEDQIAPWREILELAIGAVARDALRSKLPVEPSPEAIAAADAWLKDVRKRHW